MAFLLSILFYVRETERMGFDLGKFLVGDPQNMQKKCYF